MRNVLVTGGAGFIGSHTAVELVNAGFNPIILDDFSNSNPNVIAQIEKIIQKTLRVYKGNCTDSQVLRKVFDDVQDIYGVIHFVAFKAVGESVEHPLLYYQNNIQSLLALLEVMEERKSTRLVFSSSCTVYGQPAIIPVTEETPWSDAESPYGYTKQVGERIIQDVVAASEFMGAALLRYFNPIGAHPSGLIGELPNGTPNNLVPYITQTAAGLRDTLTIFGKDYHTPDGTCVRDYIHVVDLAKAHVAAINWLADKSSVCETFNLGSGQGNSVLEVVKSFHQTTGQDLNFEFGPRRPGDVEQIYASPAKANEVLQWKTELSLEEALKDAWNWQKNLENL
jgi:UDP-glucose 4-epimerase